MEDERMNNQEAQRGALMGLKGFARAGPAVERCDLCGLALGPEHPHLLEKQLRRIQCSCDACAVLFCVQEGGRFLRVPKRVRALDDFLLNDLEWEELMIPIQLAFFMFGEDGRLAASYPSPAGVIESQLSFARLQARIEQHRDLGTMQPLVEALLVSRVDSDPVYLLVPVDECFRLAGLIRTKWRGLSGGTEVWGAIAGLLRELRQRAEGRREARHA
jgi:hypothetical protein